MNRVVKGPGQPVESTESQPASNDGRTYTHGTAWTLAPSPPVYP